MRFPRYHSAGIMLIVTAALASLSAADERVSKEDQHGLGVVGLDGHRHPPSLVVLGASAGRSDLERFGIRLLGPGPSGEYWVSASGSALANAMKSDVLANVRLPNASERLTHSLAAAATRQSHPIGLGDKHSPESKDVYLVRLQDGILADRAAKSLANFGDVTVVGVGRTVPVALVTASQHSARLLGTSPVVRSVTQASPPFEPFTNGVRFLLQADELPSSLSAEDLDGSGVTVLVYDTQKPNSSHEAFAGRILPLDGSSSSGATHTTAVAGIIGGSGVGSFGGVYRGVAPNAMLITREKAGGDVYQNAVDIQADYDDAITNYGAVIANNSLGNRPCQFPSVPDALQGGYDDVCEIIDTYVRGSSVLTPMIVTWAVGNDRGLGNGCADYGTIMSPATSKNIISVGSIVGNTLMSQTNSGWGPTTDGRLKPELVAMGKQTGAISGAPAGAPDPGGVYNDTTYPTHAAATGYTVGFSDTSAAAPQVAGVCALLYQAYREEFGADAIMQPALMKALLIHGAQDLSGIVSSSYPGPDYQTGYGLPQAATSLGLLTGSAWIEGEVDDSDEVHFQITVPMSTQSLKVTLAWDDPPSASCLGSGGNCSLPLLQHDLDLTVLSPDMSEHFGPWILYPSSPSTPAGSNGGDSSSYTIVPDRLNNVEQIVIDAPEAGVYTIVVKGHSVPDGPQRFALVATPGLRPCGEVASLSLDRAHVGVNGLLSITLRDCDLDLNDSMIDTVQVNASSDTDSTGIMVTLHETSPSSGQFVGAVQLTSTMSMGSLTVANGDTVTVAYTDASPVMQVIDADASVDGVAPTVALDEIDDLSPTTAWLKIITSEPAIVEVEAATLCGEPGKVARSASLGVYNMSIPGYEHDVVISELPPGDEYFFTVTATDLAGNTGTLTGGCVDYVLPPELRFAVEEFKNLGGAAGDAGPRPFDLAFTSIELRPVQAAVAERGAEVTIYSVRKVGIDRLPIDPAGGEPIFPFDPTEDYDDAYALVSFADSKLFTLYDLEDSEAFGGVYIGSNGYVTFGDGDTSFTPTLSAFYAFARISALWTNLDPERGGTVTHKQLEDRFVVTWQNVPRYLSFDSNTFQIELRFDGVIVLSWLEVGITDTIVGVAPSDGSGGGLGAVPSGFIPTDLTNAGTSGFTPPSPVSRIVRTATGSPIQIELDAADEGEPYGFLRYKILSLPPVGTLKDAGTGLAITSVSPPYVLASFGDEVVFVPPSSTWDGQTSFEFVADDTWPDAPSPFPAFPSQSSGSDPIPNDGQSVPGRILIQAGERRLVRSFLVDDTLNTSGWTGFSSGQWEFGQPTGGSSQPNSNDPTSGFTGDNVIGYNLDGDYENSLSAQRLVTPAIDCTDFTGVRLRFMRWLCVQVAPDDNVVLEVSNDGVNWGTKPLWSNPTTGTLLDRGWRMVEYDISDVADGEATVYVRWTMGPTDVSGRFAGWNIDDIIVDGFIEVECPADVNGDDSVNSSDVFAMLSNQGLVDEPSPYDVNGDGIVNGEDLAIVLANIGVACP